MTQNGDRPSKAEGQQLFERGVAFAKSGQKAAARAAFQRLVRLHPSREAAWLYLAGLANDAPTAAQALDQVAKLNPTNPHLTKAKQWVDQQWPAQVTHKPAEKESAADRFAPVKRFAFVSLISFLIIIGLVLAGLTQFQAPVASFAAALVTPPADTTAQKLADLQQLFEQAAHEADHQTMIEHLQTMQRYAPTDKLIRMRLSQLYFDQGVQLRNSGLLSEAKTAFTQALQVMPTFSAAQLEARWLTLYLSGSQPHQNAQWEQAIVIYEQLYAENPTYPNVAEILYSAYFNQGIVQKAQGELEAALASFQRAAAIIPTASEAENKIATVAQLLAPPPEPSVLDESVVAEPPPEPPDHKRVIVDISEQRTYAYHNDELVFEFVVSTGEPGRDTAIGDFEILDKIPMAYASTWNLDMPFWLGIYWAGPLENGFHAVPTQRATGVTMWEGYLGQRVSYGCIVLSMRDAETLYNWVDVGTPVKVQW